MKKIFEKKISKSYPTIINNFQFSAHKKHPEEAAYYYDVKIERIAENIISVYCNFVHTNSRIGKTELDAINAITVGIDQVVKSLELNNKIFGMKIEISNLQIQPVNFQPHRFFLDTISLFKAELEKIVKQK